MLNTSDTTSDYKIINLVSVIYGDFFLYIDISITIVKIFIQHKLRSETFLSEFDK